MGNKLQIRKNTILQDSTCTKFAQVADNGKTYQYKFYSLSAIIAVGYRINSGRATQFRQWATKVLSTFTKQGYVLEYATAVDYSADSQITRRFFQQYKIKCILQCMDILLQK